MVCAGGRVHSNLATGWGIGAGLQSDNEISKEVRTYLRAW